MFAGPAVSVAPPAPAASACITVSWSLMRGELVLDRDRGRTNAESILNEKIRDRVFESRVVFHGMMARK